MILFGHHHFYSNRIRSQQSFNPSNIIISWQGPKFMPRLHENRTKTNAFYYLVSKRMLQVFCLIWIQMTNSSILRKYANFWRTELFPTLKGLWVKKHLKNYTHKNMFVSLSESTNLSYVLFWTHGNILSLLLVI